MRYGDKTLLIINRQWDELIRKTETTITERAPGVLVE